jgi:hypothetical protein
MKKLFNWFHSRMSLASNHIPSTFSPLCNDPQTALALLQNSARAACGHVHRINKTPVFSGEAMKVGGSSGVAEDDAAAAREARAAAAEARAAAANQS